MSEKRAQFVSLMVEESADIADFADGLDKDQWTAQSACPGWKVCHVIAHMAVGHTMGLASFLARVARSRGRVEQAGHQLSLDLADQLTQRTVILRFREGTSGPPRGPARLVAPAELFVDHLIHHQDIRRPLGLPRTVPPHRLAAALTALPAIRGLMGSARRVHGLRLVATDIGAEVGSGQLVTGPAEALVLVASGRPGPLSELAGPGLQVLAARLPHAGAAGGGDVRSAVYRPSRAR